MYGTFAYVENEIYVQYMNIFPSFLTIDSFFLKKPPLL